MSAYITFDNIAKHYHSADVVTRALDGASFTIEQGELAVILGPSGAGKDVYKRQAVHSLPESLQSHPLPSG